MTQGIRSTVEEQKEQGIRAPDNKRMRLDVVTVTSNTEGSLDPIPLELVPGVVLVDKLGEERQSAGQTDETSQHRTTDNNADGVGSRDDRN